VVGTVRSCLVCKGARNLCGLGTCPLMSRFNVRPKIETVLKDEFFGPATSVFIGRFGYPDVFTGPLAPMTGENLDIIDRPSQWFGTSYDSIIEMRSTLLRTKETTNIFARNRSVEKLQEIALASKTPDVEMTLKGKPVYRVSFSDVNQPMGPSAGLKTLDIAGNVKIGKQVDRVMNDEMSARESGYHLYRRGEDVYKVSTILSSGALGLEHRRKMVPTRWSITATDDIIAKEIKTEIRNYPSINEYLVFESQYLDNHFVILMMPGAWEFENFEAWAPGTPWSQGMKETQIIGEYEPNDGRKSYAEKQGGGYYASRIACLEKLKEMKKQARIVVFREVYEGYILPMGVFVVRETARNAVKNKPMKFSTKEEAMSWINSKLRIPVEDYKRVSVLLKQKKLLDFI
jgi:hypothetical protein